MESERGRIRILVCAGSDVQGACLWKREAIADVLERFHRLRGDEVARFRIDPGAGGAEGDAGIVEDAFTRLVEQGSISLSDGQADSGEAARWVFRRSAFDVENHARLGDLAGWTEAAAGGQAGILTPVEGVELEAVAMGGESLTVFTHLPDAVAEAAFVVISPNHEEIDAWAPDRGSRKDFDTGALVLLPGVDDPLPVVVSDGVDARFGATAVLGIPSREQEDRALSERLTSRPASLRLKTRAGKAEIRPALRFARRDDVLVSEAAAGVVVPGTGLVEGQGAVASWFVQALRALVPPEPAAGTSQILVGGVADSGWTLNARALAKALRDIGFEHIGEAGEPFEGALVCGDVSLSDLERPSLDLETALGEFGSEVVRAAMLTRSRPDTDLVLDEGSLKGTKRQVDRLRAFVGQRLETPIGDGDAPIDRSDRTRARLALWCDTAVKRVTLQLEGYAFHQAFQSLERLTQRIEDFERNAQAGAEAEAAVQASLRSWMLLADPLLPDLAAELRGTGAQSQPVEPSWPSPRGPVSESRSEAGVATD